MDLEPVPTVPVQPMPEPVPTVAAAPPQPQADRPLDDAPKAPIVSTPVIIAIVGTALLINAIRLVSMEIPRRAQSDAAAKK